jgi:hypothetical protein
MVDFSDLANLPPIFQNDDGTFYIDYSPFENFSVEPKKSPLKHCILKAIKRYKIGSVKTVSCACCCNSFIVGDKVMDLPCHFINNRSDKIKHLFHDDCIKAWFKLQDTCPICRCNFNKHETQILDFMKSKK